MLRRVDRVADDLLKPLETTSRRWYLWVAVLGSIVAAGVTSFILQGWRGYGITGIRWPIFWGLYVTNFVFWIGISHAGTLISAILRLVDAGWRRPVTRCAEAITAFALAIGAMFPIIHLGRPWLFFWLVPYPNDRQLWPNFRSPLVWDFFAISTYLTGSLLFLYLPMIPDFALVRDRSTGMRATIYGWLAIGWRGTTGQWHRLETAMSIMAVAIIPVAVSVHTIVSFDFSMAPVPLWQSTIFGPYFVAGAIFSGIAGLLLVMAALRKALRLEAYLTPVHFDNVAKLLLMMSLLWAYFTFNERLTTWYGNEPSEIQAFKATQHGAYSPLYWTMIVCNLVVPLVLLGIRRFRRLPTIVVASVAVIVGMWLERFLIIVPSLGHKHLSYTWASYSPMPVEILITSATFAAMVLFFSLFAKFVPALSIWELRAGGEHADRGVPAGAGDSAPSRGRPHAAYALYSSGEHAQRAVEQLRAMGIGDAEITVITRAPLDHFEFSRIGADNRLWFVASGGGALGMLAGTWLLVHASTAWPLTVGNMSTVAWWPFLILIFEMTMLGAMLATVGAFVVTARLGRRRPPLYDPAVNDGEILVAVEAPRGDRVTEVASALRVVPQAVSEDLDPSHLETPRRH